MVGQITTVLAADKINIIDMMNKSAGELAYNIIDVDGDSGGDGREGPQDRGRHHGAPDPEDVGTFAIYARTSMTCSCSSSVMPWKSGIMMVWSRASSEWRRRRQRPWR